MAKGSVGSESKATVNEAWLWVGRKDFTFTDLDLENARGAASVDGFCSAEGRGGREPRLQG